MAGGGGGSSYCSYLCSDISLGLVPTSSYYCSPQGYALVTPVYGIPNIISTYAGTGYNLNGSPGQKLGDGGVATSASFSYPFGVAVDNLGDPPVGTDVYIPSFPFSPFL